MTQKELLYIEDAIGHEENIISILNVFLNDNIDSDLKYFISEEINEHQQRQTQLMNILEEKANE